MFARPKLRFSLAVLSIFMSKIPLAAIIARLSADFNMYTYHMLTSNRVGFRGAAALQRAIVAGEFAIGVRRGLCLARR